MAPSTAIKRILLVAVLTGAAVKAAAGDFASGWPVTPAMSTASDSTTFRDFTPTGGVRQAAYISQSSAPDRSVVQANRLNYDADAKPLAGRPLGNDSVMMPEPVPAQPLPPGAEGKAPPAGPDRLFLSASDPRLAEAASGHGVLDPVETYDQNPEAPICSSGCCLNNNLWFVDAEVAYLHHSRADEKVLLQDMSFDTKLFKASDATYSWAPTANITFGKYLGRDCQNRDHDVEFTLMTPITWQGDAAITSQSRVSLFALDNQRFAGFNFADTANEHVESTFSSYEFNWRIRTRIGRDKMVYHCDGSWQRECTPNYTYSLLAGLRVIGLDDEYTLRTRIDGIPDAQFRGNYDIRTQNYLFGPQVGGDLIEQHCNWNYGARAKLGLLYGNSSSHRVVDGLDNVIGGLNPVTIDSKLHSEQLCFVGDLGLTATYNFRPNLIGRVAYDFMMVSDVAEAPRQVKFQQSVENVVVSNLVVHGLTLGFEYQW